MAIDSAKTTTSTTAQAIKNRYYDELFLRVAQANLVHQQLGQLNRQIPQGQNGASVWWTRWVNIPLVTAGQGEGVPTTAVVLSAVNVSGTNAQYDAAVSISDLMARYSFGDVMKMAMQRLAYNAGLSLDTIVRNAIVPSAVPQVATGAASLTAIPATGVLTIAELRKAKRSLELANAFRVGGGENPNDSFTGNGYWVAVLSPNAAYDIQGDTTTGAWIDTNRYAGSENIFAGEIGKLYGIRFMETSNAYSYGVSSGIVASANIYATLVAGSDLFGVTTAQNLQTFIKDFGSGGVADPTNKVATAGWKCTFGASMLNSGFGVTIQHAATA
jgi:N4-gp56 family major capsid protein